MENLRTIIKEISVSNKLQLNSYQNVVEARKNIEKSILVSQVEYRQKEKKINYLYSKGKRDKNGVLIDKLTIYNLSLKHREVLRKSMETLEQLQGLERMMLSVLNARDINFQDTRDVEEKEVIFSKL